MIAPGYPAEMPRFARGLAEVGARVLGLGDQHESALGPELRRHLAAYQRVDSLWDEDAVMRELARWTSRVRFERVECLWEPGMMLAARIRELLGVPGLTVQETIPFRDKETMKTALDRAGIRTPRHARASTARQARDAAGEIGYPLIVKPIAGAGATDTYRVDDDRELDQALARVRHVPEISVEEFVEGDELTFDTICAEGRILYFNMCWYRPRPLEGKLKEWISPQAISLRDVDAPELAAGRQMGEAVLRALRFRDGFSHMEWYRKKDGEAVFGEIGARPPGARMVDLMNFGADVDTYRGWAEAVCHGRLSQDVRRRYNAAIVFKRAQGRGRIQRIEGLERLNRAIGSHLVVVDLLPIGAPRRDWIQAQISDGYVILRHPELAETLRMADLVGTDLQLFAD
ncbi:MAG: ATP-grasp domain-containing protein [Acidobacteriota bacterium]|nr:ATP-grasp domain-containing protein [Acidobacteriota bacterium]